jgi:hypothetical protein
MKFQTVPLEQAKSLARARRIPEETQRQILEMILSMNLHEGMRIDLEPDESITALKSRIAKIAEAEGITVVVRTSKKGKQLVVWRE